MRPLLLIVLAGCVTEPGASDPDETEPTEAAAAGWPTEVEYASVCFHDTPEGCKTNDGDPVGDYRIKCPENFSQGWYECVTEELTVLGEDGWILELEEDGFPLEAVLYLMYRAA